MVKHQFYGINDDGAYVVFTIENSSTNVPWKEAEKNPLYKEVIWACTIFN